MLTTNYYMILHIIWPTFHPLCQDLPKSFEGSVKKKIVTFPTKMCDTQWNVGLDNV